MKMKEVDSLWLLLACKSGKVKELERLINQQEISTEPDLTPEVTRSLGIYNDKHALII